MKKVISRTFSVARAGGFTLVEMMIAGAVTSIAGLAIVTLFNQQYSNIKYMESVSNLDAYHQQLAHTIADVNNCNATFADDFDSQRIRDVTTLKKCVMTTGPDDCAPANIAANSAANTAPVLTQGDLILSRNFRVERFIINPTSPTVGSNLQGTGTRLLIINVEYSVNNKNLQGGKRSIIKPILTTVKFATDGRFKQCSSEADGAGNSLKQVMCEGIAKLANYDPETNTCNLLIDSDTQDCSGTNSSAPKEAYSGMGPSGVKICGPIIGTVAPPIVADPTPTDCSPAKPVSFVIGADNKVRVQCGGTPTCTECSTVIANTCTTDPAVNSCGVSCGSNGTKNCTTPPTVDCSCHVSATRCDVQESLTGTGNCQYYNISGGNCIRTMPYYINSCNAPNNPSCTPGTWSATAWGRWTVCSGGNQTIQGTRTCCDTTCSGSTTVTESRTCSPVNNACSCYDTYDVCSAFADGTECGVTYKDPSGVCGTTAVIQPYCI